MTVWLTMAIACRGGAVTPPPEAAAPPAEAPAVATAWTEKGLKRHMQKPFSAATDGVWYLAHDRLETMRIRVADLAHAPHTELSESLRPFAQNMANPAAAWAAAPDRETAARLSAETASRCAACHVASGAIPPLTEADVAIDDLTPKAVHSLAPYLMWVGLVVPSDRAWSEGSRHLVADDDPSRETEGGADYAALAERARATSAAERGAMWTEVVKTCAPCHASYGATIE